MEQKIELQKFKRIAKDIFRFEIDNKQIGFWEEEIIERDFFWKEIYKERALEDEIFEEFLRSGAPLLFVTGHVGTGKSTFIREKFENNDSCDGLIVDMRRQMHLFKKDDPEKILEGLYETIELAYRKAILDNIKYKIYHETDEFFDYHYDIKNLIDPVPIQKWKDAILVRRAKKAIVEEVLYFFQDNPKIANVTERLEINGETEEIFRDRISQKLEENYSIVNQVFNDLLTWSELIVLHRILFNSKKPHLIVIDNLDAIDLKSIQNNFLDCLIQIENYLNRESDYPMTGNGLAPIKVVISVRDENISRLNINGAAAKWDMQIKLAKDDFDIKDIKISYPLFIDENLAYHIINKRLSALKKKYGQDIILNSFTQIINNYWINHETESLRNNIGYINIKNLCNDSIRLMLDHVSSSTIRIIEKFEKLNIPLNSIKINFPFRLLQGLIISSLWDHKSTKEIMEKFQGSIVEETSDKQDYCCIYRMILTYLSNQMNYKAKVEHLILKFEKDFDESREKILETLYDLYHSQYKDAELITIYQDKLIESHKDIEMYGLIRLNPKGMLFLERITIQLDFFGAIYTNKREKKINVVFELAPIEALQYMSACFNLVKSLFENHKHYWKTHLIPKFSKDNKSLPFDQYAIDYAKGEGFYLNRVVTSHINTIKLYLKEGLKGNKGKLLCNFGEKVPDYNYSFNLEDEIFNQKKYPDDDEFLPYIKELETGNSLVKIWKKLNKYKEIQNQIQDLRKTV